MSTFMAFLIMLLWIAVCGVVGGVVGSWLNSMAVAYAISYGLMAFSAVLAIIHMSRD